MQQMPTRPDGRRAQQRTPPSFATPYRRGADDRYQGTPSGSRSRGIDRRLQPLIAYRAAEDLAVQKHEWRRSEEHTSELQSLMRISYAVFCLKKKKNKEQTNTT